MPTALILTGSKTPFTVKPFMEATEKEIAIGKVQRFKTPLPARLEIKDKQLIYPEYGIDLSEARYFLQTGFDHKIQKQTDYYVVLAKLENVISHFLRVTSLEQLLEIVYKYPALVAPLLDYENGGYYISEADFVIYLETGYELPHQPD